MDVRLSKEVGLAELEIASCLVDHDVIGRDLDDFCEDLFCLACLVETRRIGKVILSVRSRVSYLEV